MQELERRRAIFEARRNLLYEGLQSQGFGMHGARPNGAFYVYAGIDGLGWDDAEAFARELLERHAVAVTPGIDFGFQDTARHVRFAYTTEESRIAEGLERMARFIGTR